MILRQRPGGFYTCPDRLGRVRRLLWRLGFDPLTVYERLAQVEKERRFWKDRASTPDEGVDYYGLTFWGETISAQARHHADGTWGVVIHALEGGDPLVSSADLAKLETLIADARHRFETVRTE